MASTKGWKNARVQFQKELLSSGRGVNRFGQQVMINASNSFLDYVQMNKELLPYYTGNLHDSIATVVSQSGRVLRASYMPQEAVKPQNAPGRKRIIGAQEAFKMVRKQNYPRTGIVGALVVGVPYAEGANEKSSHPGYVNWLQEAFSHDMEVAVKVLEKYPKGVAGPMPTRRFEK